MRIMSSVCIRTQPCDIVDEWMMASLPYTASPTNDTYFFLYYNISSLIEIIEKVYRQVNESNEATRAV